MSDSGFSRMGRVEGWLSIAGLVALSLVPPAYLPWTYEKAYLKTFLLQTAGCLLFAAFLLAMYQGSVYRRRPFRAALSLCTCLAGWLIWNLVTILWSPQMLLALERFTQQCLMVALAFGTGYALHDGRKRRRCLQVMAVVLCPVALYTVWVYSQPYEQRLANLFSNRNLVGPFFYIPTGVAVSYAIHHWRRYMAQRNWAAWKVPVIPTILGLVYLAVLGSTQSVATLICMVGVIPFGLLITTGIRRHLVWAIPVAMVLFLVLLRVTSTYTLKDLQTPLSASSVGLRLHFWEATWRLALENPVVGVGAGNFIATVAPFRSAASFVHPLATPSLHHAHSYVLEVLAELGPLGVGLMLWLFYEVLTKSYRVAVHSKGAEKLLGQGLLAGFLAIIAHAMVGVAFSYTEGHGAFWIGVGLLLSITGVNTDSRSKADFSAAWRASFVGGFALLLIVSWSLAGLNSFRAQVHLSRGIKLKRELMSRRASVEKLSVLADECQLELEKAMSLPFAGRAYIPAGNHLSLTLNLRAAGLSKTVLEKFEYLSAALEIQEMLLGKYSSYGRLHYNIAALNSQMAELVPESTTRRDFHASARRHAKRQLSLNPMDVETYSLWLRAAPGSEFASSYALALAFNQRALSLKPDDVDHTYIGMVLLQRLNRRREVAVAARRLEELCRGQLDELQKEGTHQERVKYLLYLAELLKDSRPDEAKEFLDSALEIRPGHPKARQLQIQLERLDTSLPYSDVVELD